MNRPLLMSRAEAARFLGMSLSHFQRHVQAEMPSIRSGQLTNQSIAMLNLLAIAFLEKRPDLETGARILREHLEWLGANGIPSPVEEATAALGLLLVSARRRAYSRSWLAQT